VHSTFSLAHLAQGGISHNSREVIEMSCSNKSIAFAIAALMSLLACNRPDTPVPQPPSPSPPAPPPVQVVKSVSDDFVVIARVPASESPALDKLLSDKVLPAIGKSALVRDVNTYVARDGDSAVYSVQVRLRKAASYSTNIAFEALANGRSFEDARSLEAEIKRYFATPPLVAPLRKDLSIDRSAAFQFAAKGAK
jgi:hypothetical protein